jgi:hypothetical protein
MRLATIAAALLAVSPLAALPAQPPHPTAGRSPQGPPTMHHGDYRRPEPYGPRAHHHRHHMCRTVHRHGHRVRRCD